MTVYVVAQLTIHDRTPYAEYEARFMEVFGQFDGRLLAVDEQPKVLEGEWKRTRNVLGSFPDAASFHAWWDSPAYRDIARHRFAGSEATILLVKGLDGAPQS
jgi:uncharacterized protein (DUF1330 family)